MYLAPSPALCYCCSTFPPVKRSAKPIATGTAPPLLKCSHFSGGNLTTAAHWRETHSASSTPANLHKFNLSAPPGTFTQDQPSRRAEVPLLQSSCTPGPAVLFPCMTLTKSEEPQSGICKDLYFDCSLTQQNSTDTSTAAILTFVATDLPNRHTVQGNFSVCWHHSTLLSSRCPFSHKCPSRGSKFCSIIGRLCGAHPPQANYLPLSSEQSEYSNPATVSRSNQMA